MKNEYESKARSIDIHEFWRIHQWNIQVKAAEELKRNPQRWQPKSKKRKSVEEDDEEKENMHSGKKIKMEDVTKNEKDLAIRPKSDQPFNPFENHPAALQLGESVEDFLARIDPCSTDTSQPWIRCANFHAAYRPANEKITQIRQAGQNLLDRFMSKRHDLETSFDPPKPEGVITRMLSNERRQLEDDILRLAERNGIVSGKWLLFPSPAKIRPFWATVVRGTVDGRLGSAAKVATKPNVNTPGDDSQVICVYTENFANEADIKRVLEELIKLGVAEKIMHPTRGFKNQAHASRQIYYKPDAYTHLDIVSQNEYKIKTSLWSTSSLLTKKDV